MKTIKKLAEYIKGYTGQMIGAWVAVIIEVACEVVIPFLMQPMIDTVNHIADPAHASTN